MRRVGMHDEELPARGVGHLAAGHADDAAGMADGVFNAVCGKFAFDAIAVSYTHLDVYKRQR